MYDAVSVPECACWYGPIQPNDTAGYYVSFNGALDNVTLPNDALPNSQKYTFSEYLESDHSCRFHAVVKVIKRNGTEMDRPMLELFRFFWGPESNHSMNFRYRIQISDHSNVKFTNFSVSA